MRIAYSGKSAPSAHVIAAYGDDDISIERRSYGHADINWGRADTNATLNPNIENSTNKRVMRELFMEHGVPAPELSTEQQVREHMLVYANELYRKFIGRPDRHMKGRGFWVVDTLPTLEKALRGTKRKAPATHFMEYIEHDHEYRVHIFKGRSIRISEKAWDEDDEPMYRKSYTTVKPGPDAPIKALRKAARAAVRALGLDFGAVDIITNDDGVYVLEVNAAPGLGGSMPRVYAKTFKRWIEGDW